MTGQTGRIRLLHERQLDQIHSASLEILETVGIRLFEREGIELLAAGGGDANRETGVVRIPAAMTEAAIASAPSVISLWSRDGKERLLLGGDQIWYGTGTDLPVFLDPVTGVHRETLLTDVGNVAKVVSACDGIDFVSSHGLATDVRQDASELYHFMETRRYCNKPVWVTSTDYENTKAILQMAAVSAGGMDRLREKPTLGVFTDPTSPLQGSRDSVQKLLLCAEYSIPATWSSGIMAGATGPATLAGSLALGNAEGLAGLVLHQQKRRGAPFLYGLIGSALDMRTSLNLYGGPELPMFNTVVGQLGRYYRLPTFGTAGCSDACEPDAQAGLEMMFSSFLAACSSTNLIHDSGYLASGLMGSLEGILLAGTINRRLTGPGEDFSAGRINRKSLQQEALSILEKARPLLPEAEDLAYGEILRRRLHQLDEDLNGQTNRL